MVLIFKVVKYCIIGVRSVIHIVIGKQWFMRDLFVGLHLWNELDVFRCLQTCTSLCSMWKIFHPAGWERKYENCWNTERFFVKQIAVHKKTSKIEGEVLLSKWLVSSRSASTGRGSGYSSDRLQELRNNNVDVFWCRISKKFKLFILNLVHIGISTTEASKVKKVVVNVTHHPVQPRAYVHI